MKRHPIAAAMLLAAGLGLCGCITLFPKATPVQLYRFGSETPKVSQAGAPFNLQRSATVFDRAAQSDAILTTSGTETAYVAGARWVAPAVVLFDEAVDRAFDASGGPAHVVPRGEMGSSGAGLKLDVQAFEARYPGTKDATPVILVRVDALLVRLSDRRTISQRTFEAQKPADANRVGAMVAAFDAATSDVVGQIVSWAGTEGEVVATPAAR